MPEHFDIEYDDLVSDCRISADSVTWWHIGELGHRAPVGLEPTAGK